VWLEELPPFQRTFAAVLMSLHQTGTDETKQRELFCTSVSSASVAELRHRARLCRD